MLEFLSSKIMETGINYVSRNVEWSRIKFLNWKLRILEP